MDSPADMPPSSCTKDYIVAFGHLKIIKDNNINDKEKKDLRGAKKIVACKLPRNEKSNTSSRKVKSNGQTNVSGDAIGTSRQIYSPVKLELDASGKDKSRPSLIPRRRTVSETPTKESFPLRITNKSGQKSLIAPKNIQRVQLVNINPDLYPEVYSPPKSVASAKPIPTLGHIYRQEISNDTLTDWYLESVSEYIDVPEDTIDFNATINTPSQIRSNCITNNNEEPLTNEPNKILNDVSHIKNSKALNIKAPLKTFKSTDENVSDWLSSELDQPTKDDESGYRSMSPPSKGNNSILLRVPHDENCCSSKGVAKKSVSTTAVNKDSGFLLDEQATVIINQEKSNSTKAQHYFKVPKMNTDTKPLTNLRADIHKPFKYPSTPIALRKQENIKIPAASYVEYPSEVLQRTTNFQNQACATLSSVVTCDPEDNLSSQSMLNQVDEYSLPTDIDWSKLQSSQESTLIRSSKTSYITEESWRENYLDNKIESNKTKCSDKYSYHDYYNHYCWRKEVVKKDNDEQCPWDYKGTCKKCRRYRQIPKRNNLQRPFHSFKSRNWIGRNCKYGWSRVWKKTAERWANWSKSPSRFGKSRMMHYLQKSLIWDNTYIQTTTLVYRETGTDAVAREQKSAEITASLKLNSWSAFCEKGSSVTSPKSNKSQFNHVNVGPSMFPFLYYPSKILVGKSTNISQLSSRALSHASRKSSKNKEPKCNNGIYSRTKCTTDEEYHRNISKSTDLYTLPNYDLENSTVTDSVLTPAKDKVTSTMIHLNSIRLSNTVSRDMYTQMVVACHNAATNIKFPSVVTNVSTITVKSTHEVFYDGIDKGSDPITLNIPQRSIAVMTSKGLIQELVHKETQILPEPSIRKVSSAMAQEQYRDAKPSMVTDTTVPCRRLENKWITPKGTILSCTGTKITSVSSVQIQTVAVKPKISKVTNAVNMALSTNFVTTKNIDCLTASSLYRSCLEDTALGTDGFQFFRSEKSTSCPVLKDYTDAGVSVSDVFDRESFNGGSHHTQSSFCAAIHPECSSICINTDTGLKSKSEGTGISFENPPDNGSKTKKNDRHSQYSDPVFRKSNEPSENSRCQARIGRSRLMSVRMLGDSVAEMATQVQPIFNNTETNTAFKQKLSGSVLTSHYTFDRPEHSMKIEEETASRSRIGNTIQISVNFRLNDLNGNKCDVAINNTEYVFLLGRTLTCHCAHMGSDNEAIDSKGRKSQLPRLPVLYDTACKTNEELESLSRLMTRNGTEARQEASNAEPNFVISSNLNAAKWIKGCAKESEKDVQSIINLSETTVSESLDRASLVIARSKDNKSISEVKELSGALINHQPAISCATARAYNVNPSVSVAKILPTKDNCRAQESTLIANKENDSDVPVDRKESHGSIAKNMTESSPGIRPILRNTGTNLEVNAFQQKSASVLTSRHILPRSPIRCTNVCYNNTDCLFVYDRPRCVVHSYRVDTKIQTESPHTTELRSTRKVSISSRSIGLMTSTISHSSWKSGPIGEVLSPKVYKALYETTKLLSREGSDSRAPKNSTAETPSNKTENDDSMAESRIPNRNTSQMTSCMLFAPSHCYCARCLEADSPDDCVKPQLASSCRYYSNLLTIKLGQVKENFKRHLAPPIEETLYHTPTIPNIIFTEACTMKPSGRQDENCQAKIFPEKINTPSCILSPVLSLTDIRGRDKNDLKTVYYILTAIEGRVRRLKNNLHT